MKAALPFTAPALLAPMEGVTEPCFRELVLAVVASDAFRFRPTITVEACK